MWYSILKTGDAEIDAQHANIDAFLLRIHEAEGDARELLAKLIDALVQHFDSEEEISARNGYAMDEEHVKEHGRLAKLLGELREDVLTESLDTVMAVYSIKGILGEHIREYDARLRPES